MMELWPFTNFHDLNLDWIIRTLKDWITKMQNYIDTLNADWRQMEDDWQDFIDSTYKDQITEILEDHPEWTTTVMDGSITYEKLNESVKAYITPEAFGAVGDGVTDDTAAWQNAIDSGKPVKALSGIYKVSTLTVTNDTTINANNCEFICTDELLFNISGSDAGTLVNQSDYTANQANYTLSGNGATYTGYAMLQGSNNWNTVRDYYRAGMVCNFVNGVMRDRCPIDITNPVVLYIDPVSVKIVDIANVTFTNTHNGKIIYCKYGINCLFSNIKMFNECYHIVCLEKCYNCTISRIYAPLPMYTGNAGYTYPTAFLDTCYSVLEKSYIYNPYWHTWTTGDAYLCINNTIRDCVLYSDAQAAIEDHEVSIGTKVYNCTTNAINLSQGGEVINCTFSSRNTTGYPGTLNFMPCPVERLAVYRAENITFEKPTVTGIYGVTFIAYPKTTNNTLYYKQVELRHIYNRAMAINDNSAVIECDKTDRAGVGSLIMGTFIIDDVNLRINMQPQYSSMYDYTKAVFVIKNIRTPQNIPSADQYLYVTPIPDATTIIENSTINYIPTATFGNLTLNNVTIYPSPIFTVTGWLRGSNITFVNPMPANRWANVTNMLIGSVVLNNTDKYTAIWRGNSKTWYTLLNNDGTTTTGEIA